MKDFSRIIVLLFCFVAASALHPAFAAEEQGKHESAAFSAKDVIMEHVTDAYEWHITTINGKHISIPLPVIVVGQNGLNVFFSSKLEEGHGSYNGFYLSESEKYKGKLVEKNASGEEIRPWDFSITKNVFSLLINSGILLAIILGVASFYKKQKKTGELKAPRGFIGFMEMIVMNIENEVIKPCIGKNYAKFSPYLLTAFFFILINNLMGLIPIFPGGANVTGNIAITLILSLFTFFYVNIFGTKEYWREIFWPDVPIWLKVPPFMPIIEFVGVFTKPFALMIRLFANILAGHSIAISIVCLVFITASQGPALNSSMTVVSVLLSVFMGLVEVLVSCIQAYVFTLLSAVFIGLAQVEPHTVKR
jgi:F-type H+-transporting ATPase subunit a